MIPLVVNYATPSVFESTRDRAMLGLSADSGRPVKFHARIARDVLAVRLSLQALGELVWRSDEWLSADQRYFILDPIVTVHPDRVFFEAFSADQSAYGLVIFDRSLFEPIGAVQYGTTNVDFTAWLWAALAEMRSSRETFFRIGAEGFEVATTGAGGRFEQKVDVPDDCVRGLLQLQGAMALPGTRLSARPIDLLAAIRFLRFTKAKVSPRAIRYEFEPGEDAKLMLEPWEQQVPLRGAEHNYTEKRIIRTWGRRRLSLLEPMLPFAERVDIYLKGRALPSFYAVKFPGITFVLGLSGWTSQRWTSTASFDLLVAPGKATPATDKALAFLKERYSAQASDVASALAIDLPTASQILTSLCAEGRCIYDVESRAYRSRELFAKPIDPAKAYPPDKRRESAERFVAQHEVQIASAAPRETRKPKSFKTPEGPVYREVIFRDWVVQGRVADQADVELVLNDEDRLIFGRCGCPFFRENILGQGPCEHLLALLLVAQPQRKDAASSIRMEKEAFEAESPIEAPAAPARERRRDEDREEDLDEEEESGDDS
jgi:hypothetical protein